MGIEPAVVVEDISIDAWEVWLGTTETPRRQTGQVELATITTNFDSQWAARVTLFTKRDCHHQKVTCIYGLQIIKI